MTQLTPQHYLLSCLMEECGELTQAASKVFRFGWDSLKEGEEQYKNYEALIHEFCDIFAIMELLELLPMPNLNTLVDAKKEKVQAYLDELNPPQAIKSNAIARQIIELSKLDKHINSKDFRDQL